VQCTSLHSRMLPRRQVGCRIVQRSLVHIDTLLVSRQQRISRCDDTCRHSRVFRKRFRCTQFQYSYICSRRYRFLRFGMASCTKIVCVGWHSVLKFLVRQPLELIFAMAKALPLLIRVGISEFSVEFSIKKRSNG